MQFVSTYASRTYELTDVYGRTPEPECTVIRDVESQRLVAAQRDAYGRLYGLDESGEMVDADWLVGVLLHRVPKN